MSLANSSRVRHTSAAGRPLAFSCFPPPAALFPLSTSCCPSRSLDDGLTLGRARLHAHRRRLVAGMSNIKTRLQNARAKLLRRSSATSTGSRSIASAGSDGAAQPARGLRKSISLSRLAERSSDDVLDDGALDQRLVKSEVLGTAADSRAEPPGSSRRLPFRDRRHSRTSRHSTASHTTVPVVRPAVTLEEPTPIHPPVVQPAELARSIPQPSPSSAAPTEPSDAGHPSPLPSTTTATSTPPGPARRQSVVAHTDARVVKTLLAPDSPPAAMAPGPPAATDYFGAAQPTFGAGMLHRKIWVKRPNASATLVQIREDDLVDHVRDMILKKYANSLGRSFDAPDVALRIVPRDAHKGQERTLGPEEDMCSTLDAYFPGGQTVAEALVIDVPQKRTPKPSPRVPPYYPHHDDATHHQTEYFRPCPPSMPLPPP